jgi:hypothetical protein
MRAHNPPTPTNPPRGLTPRQAALYYRVSRAVIMRWLKDGTLGSITLPDANGRPRYVVLPRHLAEFEARHATPARPARPKRARKPRAKAVPDYFPHLS